MALGWISKAAVFAFRDPGVSSGMVLPYNRKIRLTLNMKKRSTEGISGRMQFAACNWETWWVYFNFK